MSGRVLVLGNAGVDLSIDLPRVLRPGETLIGGTFRRPPGGKGLNQAVMAARIGTEVHFLAPVGSDKAGTFVESALRTERMGSVSLPDPVRPPMCRS